MFGLLFPLPIQASTYTLGIGGITVHGPGTVDPVVAAAMPRRVDSGGYVVLHPTEISLTHKNYYHYTQTNVTILRDCFDQWAGLVGTGLVLPIGQSGDVGFLTGLYVRNRQVFRKDGSTYELTGPSALTTVNNQQIVPMVLVTSEWKLFTFLGYSLTLNIGSNWVINHFQLGVSR